MPAAEPAPNPAAVYGPPLKPQKGLAFGLLGVFVVWVAVLWVAYFTTVRSHSHVERAGPEGAVPSTDSLIVPR
ncbi:MAG TPA: hypothetical protein VGN72_11290 [Tepidisphaeraceae bacterium]|jgi:hypothetical protein|nr:hypothetical protein [Tepidisphaeraceae bacterium]